jgi:hypothetical protein
LEANDGRAVTAWVNWATVKEEFRDVVDKLFQ